MVPAKSCFYLLIATCPRKTSLSESIYLEIKVSLGPLASFLKNHMQDMGLLQFDYTDCGCPPHAVVMAGVFVQVGPPAQPSAQLCRSARDVLQTPDLCDAPRPLFALADSRFSALRAAWVACMPRPVAAALSLRKKAQTWNHATTPLIVLHRRNFTPNSPSPATAFLPCKPPPSAQALALHACCILNP